MDQSGETILRLRHEKRELELQVSELKKLVNRWRWIDMKETYRDVHEGLKLEADTKKIMGDALKQPVSLPQEDETSMEGSPGAL